MLNYQIMELAFNNLFFKSYLAEIFHYIVKDKQALKSLKLHRIYLLVKIHQDYKIYQHVLSLVNAFKMIVVLNLLITVV